MNSREENVELVEGVEFEAGSRAGAAASNNVNVYAAGGLAV